MLAVLAFGSELDGKWNFVFETEGGDREFPITLSVKGKDVTGKMGEDAAVKGVFENGLLKLEFPFYSEEVGIKADVVITGKLESGKLTGDWEFDVYTGAFEATKAK